MSSSAPVLTYTLFPLSLSQHLFHVSLQVPAHASNTLSLSLPAWIPGSYMIRDFAKNIGQLNVKNRHGEAVPFEKKNKQQWHVHTQGQACQIEYVVYAFDLSVRSAYLNDEYGFFNGTSTFVEVTELSKSPCRVCIERGGIDSTADWQLVTSMPSVNIDEDGFGVFECENYTALIDYPMLMGTLLTHTFVTSNIQFTLAFNGTPPIDVDRISRDLMPILDQQVKLFDDTPPIKRYVFITLLAEAGYGGLEHRDSTALMFPRWDLPLIGSSVERSNAYRDFLALCSHEFLHTWHVKRTKPEVFLQPDLGAEVYTEQLWIYEGFTSFYDDLALARSRIITPQQYLSVLAKSITRVLRSPGQFKQSVAESSFDAWTRFYQQDANSINHIVSYYTKGSLIALCLDIHLRSISDDKISLDDVMRVLWREYGKQNQGTPDDVIEKIVLSLTGQDCGAFLHELVHRPGTLPLAKSLDVIGITYQERSASSFTDVGGQQHADASSATLGIGIKQADLGVTVTQVREQQAGCKSGLQVNDRIIAVDQWVVTATHCFDLFKSVITDGDSNTKSTLTVVRDGRLLQLPVQASAPILDACELTLSDPAKFERWLGLAPSC
ncbi:M61 family metallopeptidase [Alteromonas oceanisediminis]|uniref:M61 family metallopeptidase n=1 Tax=Alteromonas oceanisediminis TaxID=2836180 RepID=UPI001BDB3E4E|nr:PDZ domain-containing protein [Alteromonas oceanisediminis]MBT0587194.1 PDZ domain-containing protein [Alteromonas oceanisediminis]